MTATFLIAMLIAFRAAPQTSDDVAQSVYPTLHCAYAELPTTWLPHNARLPVERQAAELLYSRLVRPVAGDAGYEPQLAVEFPLALAKGRSFELPHAPPAKWSDYSEQQPHLVTAADVAWTIRLLGREAMPGFSPAWSQALAGAGPAGADDPFTLSIRLARDHWDPLSFMHFAILPKHRFPQGGTQQEWQAFDEQPLGSGPYRRAEHNDQMVRFVAGSDVPARPAIREITFHVLSPDEAVLQLYEKRLQLVADLPAALVKQVKERGGRVVTLHPPSVWFLAPNFRHPAMQSQDLRLALAHAIDRKAILDAVFRPSGGESDHAELTGPFPHDCWAYDADVPAFDGQQASPLADEAKRKLGNLPPLKLVYRASEPGAEQACRQMAAQVGKVGIELELTGLSAAEFFPRVLDLHDFDLVYWRHDFSDQTFWLGGLLDPDPRSQARGGPNFLGYTPDASVNEFFRDLALHKRFVDLQRTMHKFHAHVARTAIVIPLWQLDTYLAIDDALAGVELSPLTLFGDVANWRFKGGEGQ
ncbi:MAG TPA: ABC transporter substrate-binding protein [Pirellulales bacterium]|nr:ABC transporter substrate-binding protein [Pirellulales bacterium]